MVPPAQKNPVPPAIIRKFSERMENAGFVRKNLMVELPANSENKATEGNHQHDRMDLFLRLYYWAHAKIAGENSIPRYPEGLYLFNRNGDLTKSNFFVMARRTFWGGLEVMYSNPLDPDKGGLGLKKGEIIINESTGLSKGQALDGKMDRIIETIKSAAAQKPGDKYYAQVHGHFGYFRDILLMDIGVDDGKSKEMEIIMNMALYHIDFDATGPHNHHLSPLFNDVKALEAAAGIVKVPACEITMPIHLYDNFSVERFVKELNERRDNLGIPKGARIALPTMLSGRYAFSGVMNLMAKYADWVRAYNGKNPDPLGHIFVPLPELNGPHITFYAASEAIMEEVQQKYLSRRNGTFPPFASELEMEPFMKLMKAKYGNKIAFGIAHPTLWYLKNKDTKMPTAAILDAISRGDISMDKVEQIAASHVQLIGAFNPTAPDKEELLFIPYSKEKLEEIRKEKGEEAYLEEARMAADIEAAREYCAAIRATYSPLLGTGDKPTHNAVNLAWARDMSDRYGIPSSFDGDCHVYVQPKFGRKYIGITGFGRTAIYGRMGHSSEEFLSALHAAKAGNRSIDAEIYWDLNNGNESPKITWERRFNSTWDNALELWAAANVYGIHGIPRIARDVWKTFREERPKNLSQLLHAAFRTLR